MEIYSDHTLDYNAEGFARLYGWWNDEEDEGEGFFTPAKKDKKKSDTEETQTDTGWDEKN